jgi:hypothetical protein
LSDPLIRTLMAADNVDPVQLESTLMRIAEQFTPRARVDDEGSLCLLAWCSRRADIPPTAVRTSPNADVLSTLRLLTAA